MPSKVFANTVFVSHSGYRSDDYLPHLQRSDDNGNTWKDISNNLPSFAINDILVFSHDSNLILVATDGGVYGTKNGGASWNRVGMNMPVFPVYDLEFDSTTKKVIAGTFARSMMSYDISQLFLSTSEKELANNLSMYPNPAANQLYFTQPFLHAQVYDLKGNKYPVIYDTDKHSLDISHLPDGIWLVSLELANHRTSVVKFIKSNN
jgi:hypothetical protein